MSKSTYEKIAVIGAFGFVAFTGDKFVGGRGTFDEFGEFFSEFWGTTATGWTWLFGLIGSVTTFKGEGDEGAEGVHFSFLDNKISK